ncbi:MAG: hypothetical protein IJ983_02510, partial [Kiritimatiellae bacterium]|nr:hypothetical protein [Kiritimatiellia bacterium]
MATPPAPDPFGELKPRRGMPPGLLRRFPDRVLVMTADRCFSRCPHCTRAHILATTLGPYSLVQPYYVAGKDFYAMLLSCRNSSNT